MTPDDSGICAIPPDDQFPHDADEPGRVISEEVWARLEKHAAEVLARMRAEEEKAEGRP